MTRLFTFLAFLAAASAQNATVYDHARLIIGDQSAPIENGAFVVQGGRIRAIGPSGEIKPPSGAARKAPVLLFGGSEGGRSFDGEAALLASRGHPALSLCYFACAGRPKELRDIELEYFVRAARLLRSRSGAERDGLAVVGVPAASGLPCR